MGLIRQLAKRNIPYDMSHNERDLLRLPQTVRRVGSTLQPSVATSLSSAWLISHPFRSSALERLGCSLLQIL